MQQRRLGPGGPLVSAVGIGAMSFSNFFGPVSEEQAFATLDAAPDLGIDHLDTSNVYGMGVSERTIGRWIARTGRRDAFRIATKASIRRDPDTGKRSFDNSPEHLEAELDGSLSRLGVEQVDLFYIHRRDPRFAIEEVTESLVALKAKGKIASFGFSEIAPTSLRRAAAVHPVAAVQSEYSLSTRLPELGMVQACEALGTALVAFSPVGRGLLTDIPPDAARVEKSAFHSANPRFSGENLARNLRATGPLRQMAADLGTSAAALAIAWVLDRSPSVIAIPGTKDVGHLRELAHGAELEMTDEMRERIARELPPGWCHGARYSDDQQIGPESYC